MDHNCLIYAFSALLLSVLIPYMLYLTNSLTKELLGQVGLMNRAVADYFIFGTLMNRAMISYMALSILGFCFYAFANHWKNMSNKAKNEHNAQPQHE